MIINKQYYEKAKKLKVSSQLISGRAIGYNTHILKSIKNSNDIKEFRNNIRRNLFVSDESSFYDFSLLMGLQFGVFNLYSYEYVSPEFKRKFINSKPSPAKSYALFENHSDVIYPYFSSKYGLTEDEFIKLVGQMFSLKEENPYYNNEVTSDLGKMVMSYHIYFHERNIKDNKYVVNYFFQTNRALSYYEECNNIGKIKR